MSLTIENFKEFIQLVIEYNERINNTEVIIKSGDIHRLLWEYPGNNHRMKSCCDAMYSIANQYNHEIMSSPIKGNGASLKIKYNL